MRVCPICGIDFSSEGTSEQQFAHQYLGYVCRECEARAVNAEGAPADFDSRCDSGDNPVFIDGRRCYRRYRFGGFVTMLFPDSAQEPDAGIGHSVRDARPAWDILVATRGIRVRPGPLFQHRPATPHAATDRRIEGMLLGIAIGDSLGNTSESMTPDARLQRYGWIDGYLPNRHADGRRVGVPSDDTQLSFRTLRQLVRDGGYAPANVASALTSGRIFGIGQAMGQYLENREKHHAPWHAAGVDSAGNGALMRVAPMLLPHLRNPSPQLWTDTALSLMTTHNDAAAIASGLGFMQILWDLLHGGGTVPHPSWWLECFLGAVEGLEEDTEYSPRGPPGGPDQGFSGSLSQWTERSIQRARRENATVRQALDSWWSGAYLLETLPSVLYILEKHAHEAERAILAAVNHARGNDTVASIVGAAVGALHGPAAFRPDWIRDLSGRTGENDDGCVQRLIRDAVSGFGT